MAWFELWMQAFWQRLARRAQRLAGVRLARAAGWKVKIDRRRVRDQQWDEPKIVSVDRRRVVR